MHDNLHELARDIQPAAEDSSEDGSSMRTPRREVSHRLASNNLMGGPDD